MLHSRRWSIVIPLVLALSVNKSLAFLPQHLKNPVGKVTSPSAPRTARSLVVVFYQQNSTYAAGRADDVQRQVDETLQRFKREAAKEKAIDQECILSIHGSRYNMTAWANAHPGTMKLLVP